MTENMEETEHEETNEPQEVPRRMRIVKDGFHSSRPRPTPARSCTVCVFRLREDGQHCPGWHRHQIVLKGREVCLDFRVGTPEVKEPPPAPIAKATRSPTKRFSFDGTKWICSKCDYTSPSKETMKSHHRRQHLPLPDRTIETNHRGKSPQLDAKFQGDDPGGLD
jgi:hypothetical protein